MKYWEMIADKLARDGWTCGVVSYFDRDGRKMICADARRGDGKRFIVHAEDANGKWLSLKLTSGAAPPT